MESKQHEVELFDANTSRHESIVSRIAKQQIPGLLAASALHMAEYLTRIKEGKIDDLDTVLYLDNSKKIAEVAVLFYKIGSDSRLEMMDLLKIEHDALDHKKMEAVSKLS